MVRMCTIETTGSNARAKSSRKGPRSSRKRVFDVTRRSKLESGAKGGGLDSQAPREGREGGDGKDDYFSNRRKNQGGKWAANRICVETERRVKTL